MRRYIAKFSSPVWVTRLTILSLAVLAIGGVVLIGYATEVGPWAYSDSAAYLATAQNIAAGRGPVLQNPFGEYDLIPLHAPLYPYAVSLPMAFGASALQSTRWLNAILFGLTIALAGWSTFHFTRSFWLSNSAAGLILATYEPVRAYAGAMSEGLFLFFGLGCLFALALSVTSQTARLRLQGVAGVLGGLAFLTRYAGLAFFGIGAVVLTALTPGRIKTRIQSVLAFLIPGILLTGVWLLPVYLSTRTFADRQMGTFTNVWPKIAGYFEGVFETIGSWLPFFYRGNHIISPGSKLFLGSLGLFALAMVPIILIRRRKEPLNKGGTFSWGFILLGYILFYIMVHLGAYVTALTQPDVNGRLLMPVYLGAVLLLAVIFHFFGRAIRRAWVGNVLFLGLALLTVWYFHGKMKSYLYDMNHFGEGYTSKRWNENPIFEQVIAHKDELPFASNDASLVLFYTGYFPDQLEIDTIRWTYDLSETIDHGLVLFKLKGNEMVGEAFNTIVYDARQKYQVVYEDNEGIIFLPY